MSYFKPKNQVAGRKMDQPFYVSWFQQQDLKRGGTAPHESRKVVEQQRQQQQGIFVKPQEAVTIKTTTQPKFKNSPYIQQQQPKPLRSNIQEISKIYSGASSLTKQFLQKRKSQEGRRSDSNNGNEGQRPTFTANTQLLKTYNNPQFSRTFTSSQGQARPQRYINNQEKRPNSQQQQQGIRVQKNHYNEEYYQDNQQQWDQFETQPNKQDEFVDNKVQRFQEDNLSDLVDSDNDDQFDDVNHNHVEQIQNVENDQISNESQDADSKRNSLSPRDDPQANRSAFQQREQTPQIVDALRRTQVNMHRPMTSEGGRRKRNPNQGDQAYQTEKQKESMVSSNMNLRENMDICDTQQSLQVVTVTDSNKQNGEDNFINIWQQQNRLGSCEEIKDFDDGEMQVEKLNTNQGIDGLWSGFRRKQTDAEKTQQDTLQDVQQLSKRPPSRHKIPPKAVCLEVPQIDQEQIPIKNMYAKVDSDEEFEETLKVNNKVNVSNFMKVQDKAEEKRPTLTSDQAERQQSQGTIPKGPQQSRNHPYSANTKYKGPKQLVQPFNTSYSPTSIQPPYSSKASQSNHNENFEIIIKHNTSSNFQKANNPVRVPFVTSLGQDFLRLFANQQFHNG